MRVVETMTEGSLAGAINGHVARAAVAMDTFENRPGSAGEPADAAAIDAVMKLTGAELGMSVAKEVMHWRSDHEQFADCWVDADGKLTGYYYGRPFSPYRDRNALREVWKCIDALGLRAGYVAALETLIAAAASAAGHSVSDWDIHTAEPEVACRAALLAVRTAVGNR